jgi:FAD/FMN-containing dehydrogenase
MTAAKCAVWVSLGLTVLLSIASVLCWHFYSPISVGPPRWVHSEARDVVADPEAPTGLLWNWGETFRFRPRRVALPATVQEVVQLVRDTTQGRMRVVGGGHSFNPQIATRDTLLDLRRLDQVGDVEGSAGGEGWWVVAGAGAKVRRVQRAVVLQGFNVHGFGGGTHQQTLAGGISTNLHGSQSKIFAEHVLELQVVLANGTLANLTAADRLFHAVKSGMGLLGVVVQVKLQVYPRVCLLPRTTVTDLDTALQTLLPSPSQDSVIGEYRATEFGLRGGGSGVLHEYVEAPSGQACPVDFAPNGSPGVSETGPYLTDNWLVPLQVLFLRGTQWGWVTSLFNGQQLLTDPDPIGLELGWRYTVAPMFGQVFTEYTVPSPNCSAFVRAALRRAAEQDVVLTSMTVRKLLPESGGATLLAYAPVHSCAVEIYLPPYQSRVAGFVGSVQAVAFELGGRTHLGTNFFGTSRSITDRRGAPGRRAEEFWATVAEVDPTGKFSFASQVWERGPYVDFNALATRAVVFRASVVLAALAGAAMLVSSCFCCCGREPLGAARFLKDAKEKGGAEERRTLLGLKRKGSHT